MLCNLFIFFSGFYLLWQHISDLYNENMEYGLKLLSKLTTDHIVLKLYSLMRVYLVAQVISEKGGTTLKQFGPKEANATAEICLKMDKIFDCLNVRKTRVEAQEK